jgi:hypothetical protein
VLDGRIRRRPSDACGDAGTNERRKTLLRLL